MKKDSIVILAWPETLASEIRMWYDPILRWFKINKNGYYKAGHAAAVLINHDTKELDYFDFGRYHMPHKFGRVRDKFTDRDLTLNSRAQISADNTVSNLNEIITEISYIEAFHGTGTLYATHLEGIDFHSARKYAKNEQNKGMIPYGPLDLRGNNCSRFINRLIRAGKPGVWISIKLFFSITLTPTTKWNINAAKKKQVIKIPESIYLNSKNKRTKDRIEKSLAFMIQSNKTA